MSPRGLGKGLSKPSPHRRFFPAWVLSGREAPRIPTRRGEAMADSNSTRSIGFVGLGAMGLSVVQNLARAGYRVQGFDLATGALATLE